MSGRTIELAPRESYEFCAAVTGHGWFDLPPFEWNAEERTLAFAFEIEDAVIEVHATPSKDGGVRARIATDATWTRAFGDRARRAIRRALRLDDDLRDFWRMCRSEPDLSAVPAKRAGHLLRGPSLFEDLLKLLFTTNCSWAATRSMTSNLVKALGTRGPNGVRAFPTPERCARKREAFWRDSVRVGYRAPHCIAISKGFADGSLGDDHFDPDLPTDELRERLLALPGFGPYAVGQALRLLGHYQDLALDSWCRATMKDRLGRSRPPSDRWFERRYAKFGDWRGLALWMDLTRGWRGEI